MYAIMQACMLVLGIIMSDLSEFQDLYQHGTMSCVSFKVRPIHDFRQYNIIIIVSKTLLQKTLK